MPRWPTRTPEERHARKRQYTNAYRAAHRLRIRALARASYHRNRDTMTPEEIEKERAKGREKAKRHRAKYPAQVAEGLVRLQAWGKANPERIKAAARTWEHTHHEHVKALKAASARAYPQQRRMREHKRRARKQSAPRNDVTLAQQQAVIAAAHGVCPYCSVYKPGCQACQKGTHKLTIDHLTPLADGGSHTLHNLIACCRSCNTKKYTGNPPVPVQPLLL